MSLAALGANPDHRWTITADGRIGGANPGSSAKLGTIGYSDDGGVFVCVQADGAMGANLLAQIRAGYQAAVSITTNIVHGAQLGATTAAFADNEYGWVQIYGLAELTAEAAISTAGGPLRLTSSTTAADAGKINSATAATPEALGIHAVDTFAVDGTGTAQLCFPVNRA